MPQVAVFLVQGGPYTPCHMVALPARASWVSDDVQFQGPRFAHRGEQQHPKLGSTQEGDTASAGDMIAAGMDA